MAFFSVAIAGAIAVLVLPVASLAGLFTWNPKLPVALLWWAPTNLLITSVAEEAVFRGFLQQRLNQWLGPRLRHGELLAVATAAVLFGVAHLAGGVAYVAVATIAGFGYGLAYRCGGGLLAVVLAHFLLNAIHFTLLAYPWFAV